MFQPYETITDDILRTVIQQKVFRIRQGQKAQGHLENIRCKIIVFLFLDYLKNIR